MPLVDSISSRTQSSCVGELTWCPKKEKQKQLEMLLSYSQGSSTFHKRKTSNKMAKSKIHSQRREEEEIKIKDENSSSGVNLTIKHIINKLLVSQASSVYAPLHIKTAGLQD